MGGDQDALLLGDRRDARLDPAVQRLELGGVGVGVGADVGLAAGARLGEGVGQGGDDLRPERDVHPQVGVDAVDVLHGDQARRVDGGRRHRHGGGDLGEAFQHVAELALQGVAGVEDLLGLLQGRHVPGARLVEVGIDPGPHDRRDVGALAAHLACHVGDHADGGHGGHRRLGRHRLPAQRQRRQQAEHPLPACHLPFPFYLAKSSQV